MLTFLFSEQSERNAVMQEYSLVMSERDSVHKDMDKLQEELGVATRKLQTFEQKIFDTEKQVCFVLICPPKLPITRVR